MSRQFEVASAFLGAPLVLIALTLAGSNLGFQERRYDEFLLPAVAASLALVLASQQWVKAIVVAITILGTVGGSSVSIGQLPATKVSSRPFGSDVSAVVTALMRDHVTTIWAGYWDAYRITATTHERIVSGSFPFDRYPDYNARAQESARVLVVPSGSANDHYLMTDSAPDYIHRHVVGGLVIYRYGSVIDLSALSLTL